MGSFVIEEAVIFSPADAVLINLRTNERVNLPLVASGILQLLLVHHAGVVSRDTLFTEVIDKYSAVATNNNLNQYIMALRKQLHYLGIEAEVISTVPRIGFMIPRGISVERKNQGENESLSQPDEQKFLPETAAPKRSRINNEKWWLGGWTVLMLSLMLGASIYSWFYNDTAVKWSSIPSVNPIPINDDKMCQIFVIPSSIVTVKYNVNAYKDIINQFGMMKCEPKIMTHYYIYSNVSNQKNTVTLFFAAPLMRACGLFATVGIGYGAINETAENFCCSLHPLRRRTFVWYLGLQPPDNEYLS
jgi:DNA-binding winged-HTH domains